MQPSEYEQLLHDAEIKLSRLKALYEQYFQGIEKLEPTVPRKDLDRVFEVLRKGKPRNTALRFRTQMLVAKYGTYQTYWQRVARQIEEGTFRRDVVRAQQRRLQAQRNRTASPTSEAPVEYELDLEVELEEPESASASLAFDESDVDAILGSLGPKIGAPATPAVRRALSPFASALPPANRSTPLPPSASGSPAPPATTPQMPVVPRPPATATFGKPVVATFGKPGTASFAKPVAAPATATPQPPAARPPAPATAAVPAPVPRPAPAVAPPPAAARDGLDDARMRRIYDSYVEAKRRNNERTDNVKFESLAQSVQQMMPKLREKHGPSKIDFEVVVQNGKVGLKPKVEK